MTPTPDIPSFLDRYLSLQTEWEAIEHHACGAGIDTATAHRQIEIERQMDALYPQLPQEVRDAWDRGEPTPVTL